MRLKRILFLVAMMATLALAAQTAKPRYTGPRDEAGQPVGKKRPPSPQQIEDFPKEAVMMPPDIWRMEDEEGFVWIYRNTVFGKQRSLQTADLKRQIDDQPPFGVSVVEKDGKLTFSRQTPFGGAKWTKEKGAELNDVETAALAWYQQRKSGGTAKPSPTQGHAAEGNKE